MSISNLAKAAIPLPAVSADDGACRYVVLGECGECISIATRKRIIHLFGAGENAEPETASIGVSWPGCRLYERPSISRYDPRHRCASEPQQRQPPSSDDEFPFL